MKLRVLWTLRGRSVVEIPDDTDEDSWDEVVGEKMDDYTTDEWQWDSDGYEIDDIDDNWTGVDIHPNLKGK